MLFPSFHMLNVLPSAILHLPVVQLERQRGLLTRRYSENERLFAREQDVTNVDTCVPVTSCSEYYFLHRNFASCTPSTWTTRTHRGTDLSEDVGVPDFLHFTGENMIQCRDAFLAIV